MSVSRSHAKRRRSHFRSSNGPEARLKRIAPRFCSGRIAPDLSLLRQLAQTQGIQLDYFDMNGTQRSASPETLQALLALWNFDTHDSAAVREALRSEELRRSRQRLPPVIVAWDGALPGTPFAGVEGQESNICGLLHLEDGGRIPLDFINRQNSPEQFRLPPGYHRLELESSGRAHSALVISAPLRSYQPPEQPRAWGSFLPLYAAHSAHSWGAGNLGDWKRLTRWGASLGGRVVSTLPLTASFLKPPVCEPSPYSSASRLFWNEFYVDIEALPEFATCRAARKLFASPSFQKRLATFRRDGWIDYPAQTALRRQILELLSRWFFAHSTTRRESFEQFLREQPRARDYAEFRAAMEQTGLPWGKWPERMRQGKIQGEDFSPGVRDYHLYAQWVAHGQMTAFARDCRRRDVRLYLDLPLGVHPDSYDVWRERGFFAETASVGAPPDVFFSKGQNWGFPPLHPQRIRQLGYSYFIEYLRFHMRCAGLLRLDHIMGLHRLYWIPTGFPADQGAYVSYPAEELQAILTLESHRNKTVIIGENLGTVPPEVNEDMARHEFRQMYVVQYELRPDSKKPLRTPPAQCVASMNTHDVHPFAAHWRALDLADRLDLGLLDSEEMKNELNHRRELNAALIAFLKSNGCLEDDASDTAPVLTACLRWLAASPADFVLINLEDLWQEERPQNVPGTSTERPNWRRKARWSIEQVLSSRELRKLGRELTRLRQQAKSAA